MVTAAEFNLSLATANELRSCAYTRLAHKRLELPRLTGVNATHFNEVPPSGKSSFVLIPLSSPMTYHLEDGKVYRFLSPSNKCVVELQERTKHAGGVDQASPSVADTDHRFPQWRTNSPGVRGNRQVHKERRLFQTFLI